MARAENSLMGAQTLPKWSMPLTVLQRGLKYGKHCRDCDPVGSQISADCLHITKNNTDHGTNNSGQYPRWHGSSWRYLSKGSKIDFYLHLGCLFCLAARPGQQRRITLDARHALRPGYEAPSKINHDLFRCRVSPKAPLSHWPQPLSWQSRYKQGRREIRKKAENPTSVALLSSFCFDWEPISMNRLQVEVPPVASMWLSFTSSSGTTTLRPSTPRSCMPVVLATTSMEMTTPLTVTFTGVDYFIHQPSMDSMVNSWLYRASGNEGSVTTGVSTHTLAQGRHGRFDLSSQGLRLCILMLIASR